MKSKSYGVIDGFLLGGAPRQRVYCGLGWEQAVSAAGFACISGRHPEVVGPNGYFKGPRAFFEACGLVERRHWYDQSYMLQANKSLTEDFVNLWRETDLYERAKLEAPIGWSVHSIGTGSCMHRPEEYCWACNLWQLIDDGHAINLQTRETVYGRPQYLLSTRRLSAPRVVPTHYLTEKHLAEHGVSLHGPREVSDIHGVKHEMLDVVVHGVERGKMHVTSLSRFTFDAPLLGLWEVVSP